MDVNSVWMDNFNSLPHAEVDIKNLFPRLTFQHFNSLPHAEVDDVMTSDINVILHFNSLPHAEVDFTFHIQE